MAMNYKTAYVASVALGSKDEHTLKAFLEAESFNGPSIIIAYSHCIAHGINMSTAMDDQKAAVDSGQWLLYRYDPRRTVDGQNPMQLDSKKPKIPVLQYLMMENRFKMLTKMKVEESKALFAEAQKDVDNRFSFYEYLAGRQMEAAKSE